MDENSCRLSNELAKIFKTPDDLSQFDRLLKKISVEAASMPGCHHLGYDKNQPKLTNTRNGYSTKTVATADGPLNCVPRSRSHLEPQFLKKTRPVLPGWITRFYPVRQDDHPRDSSCVQRDATRMSRQRVSKSLTPSWSRLLSGKTGHWMQSGPIVYLDCIVLVRTVASSINPCFWLWASTRRPERTAWVCGWPK